MSERHSNRGYSIPSGDGTTPNPFEIGAPPWIADALCAQTDPEAFFPGRGAPARDAKEVCLECPVRAQCLDYAIDNDERHGIWGGLSERELRKVKRERKAAA